MKKHTIPFLAIAAIVVSALSNISIAQDAKEVEAGPRGGRLLDTEGSRPEFFVEKDHTVSVKFFNEAKEIVAPTTQEVTVIATGEKKAKLQLTKKDDALVSTEPLPEGDGYNLVVQVKPDADSRPTNFRFLFLNHICAGPCANPEYACTCNE